MGYSSAFLGQTHTVTNVAPGITYVFRLRAQNVHGWSDWSTPYTEIVTASVPAKMAILQVADGQLSDTAVQVSFVTPNSRGSEILSYEFFVQAKDGEYYSATELLGVSIAVQNTSFEVEMNLLT